MDALPRSPAASRSRHHLAGFLYLLALLPGSVAIVYHLISTPARRPSGRRLIRRYEEIRDAALNLPSGSDSVELEEEWSHPAAACCASLLVTGVFLLIAVIAGRYLGPHKDEGPLLMKSIEGIVFCGIGAYVAVLYYMAGRLYANALSSRFMTTSALRSASAIAVGWVAGMIGIDAVLPSNTSSGVFFVVGLFYNWAISAMRNKALVSLGAPKSDNDELPMTIVEGIDDTAADLLSEYGITTLQHLIEGGRTATDLARIYALAQSDDPTAGELLKSLAERTANAPALHMICREFQFNLTLNIIYQTLEGKPLAPPSGSSSGGFSVGRIGSGITFRAAARL